MSKFYLELTKRNIYVHAHFYLACLMSLFIYWSLSSFGTEQIKFYLSLGLITFIGFFYELKQHSDEKVKARKELRQPVPLMRDSTEDMLFNYLGWVVAYLIWY